MAQLKMPALFVGHGSPMNAVEDNEFSQAWRGLGRSLPRPTAIVCVSAHWETLESAVTAVPEPKTIHDFFGFPEELNQKEYPAAGSPDLAARVQQLTGAQADLKWGLDHGAWSVLCRMYPQADIPVVQLSLDRLKTAQQHYDFARQLQSLREEGVLILGSGNIVHNLRMVIFEDTAYDWAVEFDQQVKRWIVNGDHQSIIHYESQGRAAALAVNTAEHYLPLLYVLGLQQPDDPVKFHTEKVTYGSLSMRCVQIG